MKIRNFLFLTASFFRQNKKLFIFNGFFLTAENKKFLPFDVYTENNKCSSCTARPLGWEGSGFFDTLPSAVHSLAHGPGFTYQRRAARQTILIWLGAARQWTRVRSPRHTKTLSWSCVPRTSRHAPSLRPCGWPCTTPRPPCARMRPPP
jgi:hypothetical protein